MTSKKNGGGLNRVCHKHLHALGRHFGLQIKKLKTDNLRSKLRIIWDNRLDLDKLKLQHPRWFRLIRRPEHPDDLHGVYANRVIRENIEPRLTEAREKGIVEEIAGVGAWEI